MTHLNAIAKVLVAILVIAVTVPKTAAQPPTADTIYQGGTILTINPEQPEVEAVATREGKIVACGSEADLMKLRGETTRLIDLKGQVMLPGFVDGHGHCFQAGLHATVASLLPPPDSGIDSIAKIQGALRKWSTNPLAQKYKVILGNGYDDSQLKEQRHPTRQELDEVSTDMAIMAIHQSGHLATVNSKALEQLGYTADTPNPPGGAIRREDDGKTPNGVLEENALMLAIAKLLPPFNAEELDRIAKAGQQLYAEYGYTMAQEGRSLDFSTETWLRLAESDGMLIDVVCYPDITATDKPMGLDGKWHTAEMKNGFRIGGVKLSFDGSPQGKTAYLSKPYFVPPHGRAASYRGYPILQQEEANRKVDLCYRNGWQFLIHCNGDSASDQMLEAVRQAQKTHGKDASRRDVMVHCQTVRFDQLGQMKDLGIYPSFFGLHCFYWGDWHRDSVLGPERAERISPARTAQRMGMKFTEHHDAPVTLPSAIRILSAVVTRRTRSGDILGAAECLDVDTALRTLTIWAAEQHFEESRRGSIAVGKLADFVVLDRNPHEVDLDDLASIEVQQTIKEDKMIYEKK
ncbi:amidohydrolase [Fuerstiella marisgermanici]|uniref:N-substituted formamide deformylase n=1 Tax=Fuerstiella marisgermanici TaxID=1891926 RepID=A0A1P8WBY3_9PLAN|nr:amidohydrolase [Fuerstiella marisgermanici]APZ91580.1 N-substituted formamide deformylase precursor [Fuerstiella marisgermanici]